MTLAPAPAVTNDPSSGAPATATVTAVLVTHDSGPWLSETLDALARQSRAPDRLLVVDNGCDGNAVEQIRGHAELGKRIPQVRVVTVPGDSSPAQAVLRALAEDQAAQPCPGPDTIDHLWLLTADSAPAPMTLTRLLDAVRRSPSVGIAGPKLLHWSRPGALHSVGVQLTRSGRVVPEPAPGEPDQGQYDRRTDVLAVPFAGLLVERALYERLGGHESAFGEFGGDLDLSWRAQQAGRRVIVVPRAIMRTGAAVAGPRALYDGPSAWAAGPNTASDGPTTSAASAADEATGLDALEDFGREPDDASTASASVTGAPRETTAQLRRQARRVALARCAVWAAPFLALWIAATSLVAGLALLLVKRPRAAWAEFGDIGAVLTPGRSLSARWRSRGTRTLRRRDLVGLFVGPTTALRHTGDLLRDEGVDSDPRGLRRGADIEPVESGPVADEALDLNVMATSWASQVARNPGVLAVAVASVLAVVAGRDIRGSLSQRIDSGLVGGELVGVRADASTLWHSWLDGWHGAGLGHSGEQSPHLAVLAGLSWVGEHLPVLEPASSPVGALVAVLMGLAIPVATLTAYLGGRVVTHSRWPRGLAALAWGTTALVATGIGAGRLGAAVAAMLLPLVAAGFALAARRVGSATAVAATALGAAVLAAFMPALLVFTIVAALLLAVLGRGRGPRLRGLTLLVVPVALLGPWVLELVRSPHLLLSGPGLAVWGGQAVGQGGGQAPLPWEIALIHPGGPGSYPVLITAPIVLAGLLGLLRGGARSAAATWLMLLALAGLALALAAPRLTLGTVPEGAPLAGEAITAWAGIGLFPYALALIAAALLGADQLAVRQSTGGLAALARWPIGAAVIASVVLSVGWIGAKTVGSELSSWAGPRPAVALDQAEGPLANRMLVLEPRDQQVGYSLLGREVSGVTRDLPLPQSARPSDPALVAAVGALFERGGDPDAASPSEALAAQAIGFVGLRAVATDPRISSLDATAGLSRLGQHGGVIFWRVLPGGAAAQDDSVAPSRARLTRPSGGKQPGGKQPGESAVPVSGDHGRLSTELVPGKGARLVMAEPTDWAAHARVTFNGTPITSDPKAAQPTYALPAGPGQLTVDVPASDHQWRWAQCILLALIAFLAVPLGGRTTRRRS